ncbi:MAG: hypothetical protein IJ017_03900 [Oscillospiraceae bacterium]|nr:hypothetical protein [Oscillospiraceae bacterium]
MAIKAIVYTSNTGYTADYAKLLHDHTDLPVYSLEDSRRKLKEGTEIVYLGWLMAGSVVGYKEAAKLYKIKAVCGVCLAASGSLTESVRKTHSIPNDVAVFTIQGGFDMKKLKGGYKLGMMVMSKILKKKLTADTEENRRIINMLDNGGSCVSADNLKDVISLVKAEKSNG